MSSSREILKAVLIRGIPMLGAIHEATAEILNANLSSLGDQSLARRDMAVYGERVDTMLALANNSIEVAADNLAGLERALTGDVLTLASANLARGCIEACAQVAWLLDHNVTSKTRIARTFGTRYAALRAQETLLRAQKATKADIKRVGNLIDKLERDASKIGINAVMDRKGHRIGVGEIPPGSTDLVSRLLGDGSIYRLLSAVVHGQSFATRQVSYDVVPSGVPAPSAGFGNVTPVKTVRPEWLLFMCRTSVDGFIRALMAFWLACGWDFSGLVTQLQPHAKHFEIDLAKLGREFHG